MKCPSCSSKLIEQGVAYYCGSCGYQGWFLLKAVVSDKIVGWLEQEVEVSE